MESRTQSRNPDHSPLAEVRNVPSLLLCTHAYLGIGGNCSECLLYDIDQKTVGTGGGGLRSEFIVASHYVR